MSSIKLTTFVLAVFHDVNLLLWIITFTNKVMVIKNTIKRNYKFLS